MTNDENNVLIDTNQIRAVSETTNLDDVSNVFHKVGDFFNEIVAVQKAPTQSVENDQSKIEKNENGVQAESIDER